MRTIKQLWEDQELGYKNHRFTDNELLLLKVGHYAACEQLIFGLLRALESNSREELHAIMNECVREIGEDSTVDDFINPLLFADPEYGSTPETLKWIREGRHLTGEERPKNNIKL